MVRQLTAAHLQRNKGVNTTGKTVAVTLSLDATRQEVELEERQVDEPAGRGQPSQHDERSGHRPRRLVWLGVHPRAVGIRPVGIRPLSPRPGPGRIRRMGL